MRSELWLHTPTNMLLAFGEARKNASLAARLYVRNFSFRRHQDHSTLFTMFSNLTCYGIFNEPRERERAICTGNSSVLDRSPRILDNPHTSVLTVASALPFTVLTVGTTSLTVILAEEQSMNTGHSWRFTMKRACISRIIWTDEARFGRSGTVNTQNRHPWSAANPYWLLPENHEWQWLWQWFGTEPIVIASLVRASSVTI